MLLSNKTFQETPYETLFLDYFEKYFRYRYPEIKLPKKKIRLDTSRVGHFMKNHIVIYLSYIIEILSHSIAIPPHVLSQLKKYLGTKS